MNEKPYQVIKSFIKTLSISAILASLVYASYASSDEKYAQIPQELKASEILSEQVINGANYKIDESVINDGAINIYTIRSDYGNVLAEGTAELHMRIAEFRAISAMEEMDRSEVFGDALGAGLKAPVKGVVSLAKEPVNTAKAAGKGLGQFMSNIGRSLVSDDPDQDNTLSVLAGYDVAKRQFAYELDINPYTSNEVARDYLGQISRAAVAGGIVPRAAMAAIDSTAITIARVTGTTQGMKKLVRDNPPGKLDSINREKLIAMGISEGLAEAFLDNYHYNPYEETILVGELEAMDGVDGRENFILVAVRANEDSVAHYYRTQAMMFEAYHTHFVKLKEIHHLNLTGTAYVIDDNGKLLVISPVDYLFWTLALEEWLGKFQTDIKDKEIWIAGYASDQVKSELENRGWVLVENADEKLLKDL